MLDETERPAKGVTPSRTVGLNPGRPGEAGFRLPAYGRSMASLSDLSRDIAGILERAAAGIVRVDARRGRPATGIVWSDNLVLTADHVIEHDDAIQVSAGGAVVKAAVAGRDPGTDLALLKTDGLTASPLARAASADVRIGHLVLAVRRTSELQVTLGIVSGLSGAFRSWRGGEPVRLIQATAELLPGFSGGPLLDGDGRVIGINSWNFGRGITRAIPIETAAAAAENLQTHGRIRRAYLGLGAQPVRLGEALRNQLGQDSGDRKSTRLNSSHSQISYAV